MVQPDPALGIAVDFDNEGFRNAIHFAMQMGTNPDPDRRPVFMKKSTDLPTYWKDGVRVFDPAMGRSGQPLDPDIEVIVQPDEPIEVDCAIEVIEGPQTGETGVGSFKPNRLSITLLDVDYVQIKGCKELVYNGDRYVYDQEPESQGLFDVGVYVVIYKVWDES